MAEDRPLPDWVPTPPRPRRRWPLVVGAVAVVVAITVVAAQLWTTSENRAALGDPRTADPCSLLDVAVFDQFGEARLDPDYGGFNRCDVLIDLPDGVELDVLLQFDGQESTETPPVTVQRSEATPGDDGCTVTMTLTDFGVVEVVTKTDEVPRRADPDPRSLADACTLLTPTDLAAVPGYVGAEPNPRFADWTCRWNGVQVIFDRGNADSAEDGTTPRQLADHDVYVEEDGYGEGTCAAKVVNLRYQSQFGDPLVETALVVTQGDQPMEQLCALATTFAGPVAAKLPS